jgi:hypothetical protein
VRTVAALGAELEPQGAVAAAAWALQLIVVVALLMVGRARR